MYSSDYLNNGIVQSNITNEIYTGKTDRLTECFLRHNEIYFLG